MFFGCLGNFSDFETSKTSLKTKRFFVKTWISRPGSGDADPEEFGPCKNNETFLRSLGASGKQGAADFVSISVKSSTSAFRKNHFNTSGTAEHPFQHIICLSFRVPFGMLGAFVLKFRDSFVC